MTTHVQIALVLGGDPPSSADHALLEVSDRIVCTDGGAAALLALGKVPHVIVGDMDSLDPALLRQAEAAGAHIERHPRDKTSTDGELAMETVLRLRPDGIVILGAHGGRTAMLLTHLRLLRQARAAGIETVLVGQGELWRLLEAGDRLLVSGRNGSTLNLLALDGDALVDLEGTRFDATGIRLTPLSGRGLSNTITADDATIRVREGRVLIITETGAQP